MQLAHAAKKFGTCSFGNIVPNPKKDTPEGVIRQIQDTLKAYFDATGTRRWLDRTRFSGGLQGIVRPFTRHDVDADFLVFDNDLLTAEHEGFSYNKPRDVYFAGKKLN